MKQREKRVFLILLVLLVLILGTAKLSFGEDSPEYLRIGLYHGSSAISECVLESDGGFLLGSATADGFTEHMPLPAYNRVLVTVENGLITLRSGDEKNLLISADLGKDGSVYPANKEKKITINGITYRGGSVFHVDSSGMLVVINRVTVEEYLYGVLHREMSQSHPIEALKAQAVASRSFALLNVDRHAASGFDLCNGSHCQVYGGTAVEYPKTIEAVDATHGMHVWFKEEPVAVYYHKNSGGHTQGIEDVWSTPAPYLKGVADPFTPEYPWIATILFDHLREKLEDAGYDPGPIKSVQIGARNSAQAVKELIIVGENREIKLEKERIRTVLGTSTIRSRHFNIGESYQGSREEATNQVTVSLHNGEGITDAGSTIHVMGADEKRSSIPVRDMYVTNGEKTVQPPRSLQEQPTFDDTIMAIGDDVTFSGRGFGHGVGLSQDGAIEMAKMGYTFEEILHFYLTGIEVR